MAQGQILALQSFDITQQFVLAMVAMEDRMFEDYIRSFCENRWVIRRALGVQGLVQDHNIRLKSVGDGRKDRDHLGEVR